MRFIIVILILFSFPIILNGQTETAGTGKTETTPKKKKKKTGTTGTTQKKKRSKTYLDDGRDWRIVYVVQVMSNTDRTVVYENKAKLYQMYPTQRIYVKNELPFYRLRLGFFSTKAKAEEVRKKIGDSFGEPALVVKDKVVLNTIKRKIRRTTKTEDGIKPKKN